MTDTGEPAPPRDPRRRVIRIAAAVAVVGLPLHAFAMGSHLPTPPLPLGWWTIAIGFLITELLTVELHIKGDAHGATFSEVPLLLGLAASSPMGLIAGRLLGTGAALAARREPHARVAFNLALAYLDTAAALVLYHWLLGGHGPDSIRGLAAAAAVLIVTLVLDAALVAVAVSAANPGRSVVAVARSLGTGLVVSAVASAVALVGLVLFWRQPVSLVGVAVVGSGLIVAFRVYGSLGRRFEDLEAVHAFTSAVDGAVDSEALVAATLEEARRLFSARFAEVVLSRGVESSVTWSDGDGDPQRRPAPPALVEALAGSTGPMGAWMIDQAPEVIREHYRERGVVDGMVAVMGGGSEAAALLAVGSRERNGRFRPDDLRLFETLARQARVAFERGHLVDRLRREMQRKEHQALHDALTGLPNRLHFMIVVEEALRRARDRAGRVAVLLVDLDRFKEVNDTLGHERGDALLQDLAMRLSDALGDDHIARLGGDEFGILLREVGGVAEVTEWARRVGSILQQPFLNEGLAIRVAGSIGIALAPDHGMDGATLLRRADVAMYEAKAVGSTFEVYDPQRDRYSTRRLALAGELRDAIESGSLAVHYQPKASLRDGSVNSIEALARWLHPRHGFVPPDEFIRLAEQTGLIRPLTEHVLRMAFRDRNRLVADGRPLGVAVNIAASSLQDADFPDLLVRLIGEYDMDPQAVTLEVTETTMMTDSARARMVLAALDEVGVTLSIDDFGTGYSSLTYLSSLPVDEVKIDRSFVMDMAVDERLAKIVSSTTSLVHSLGRRVVAEGVENRGTWDLLREAGCDHAQGYYVARPLGFTDLSAWLAAGSVFQGDSGPRLGVIGSGGAD